VRLQENAGLVSNVNCGDIVRLPLVMQTARFGNPPIGAADAFSMWIEYETKSGETKKPCAANASRSQSANDKRGQRRAEPVNASLTIHGQGWQLLTKQGDAGSLIRQGPPCRIRVALLFPALA
jgi:hypothetical protein